MENIEHSGGGELKKTADHIQKEELRKINTDIHIHIREQRAEEPKREWRRIKILS